MEHIWTILMLQILQAHLFRAFVVNLKLVAIFALCPESFCDKNLAALAERTVAILTSIVKIPHLKTKEFMNGLRLWTGKRAPLS